MKKNNTPSTQTDPFPQTWLYGSRPAAVSPAAGAKGFLIRTIDGELLFRVYKTPDGFIDYEIRHDDLSVVIARNELAAFYRTEGRNVLDHSPPVLGLEKVSEL